jgi:hypothetical protein
MTLALLAAAALLAQTSSDEPPATAGQFYDGCVRYVAHAGALPDSLDEGASTCALTAAANLASNAVQRAVREVDRSQPDPREFCVPESIAQTTDDSDVLAVVRIFITYVHRNPASRSAGALQTLDRALAEAWPCPR